MIKKFVKFPKDKSKKEIRQFFLNKSLESFIRKSSQKSMEVNDMITNKPYKPELADLYRLYEFVVLNKRTTILEFGSGYSSLMFLLALQYNKKKYFNKIKINQI